MLGIDVPGGKRGGFGGFALSEPGGAALQVGKEVLDVTDGNASNSRPLLLFGVIGQKRHRSSDGFQIGELIPYGGFQALEKRLPNLVKTEVTNPLNGQTSVGTRELKSSILYLKTGFWWAWMDSNRRPRSYQDRALTT